MLRVTKFVVSGPTAASSVYMGTLARRSNVFAPGFSSRLLALSTPSSAAMTTASTDKVAGREPTTQPVQINTDAIAQEAAAKIGSADEALRRAYDELPETYPEHAMPTGSDAAGQAKLDKTTAYRKRLLYRSKQRGWLEVDLLLGSWADARLSELVTMEQLRDYEYVLNMETVDLFNYLQGMAPLPAIEEDVKKGVVTIEDGEKTIPRSVHSLLVSIIEHINKHPITTPQAYQAVKSKMSN